MGALVLWLVLLVVAVGLPLLVLRLDRYAAAHPVAPLEDSWGFQKRNGLSSSDAEAVRRALRTGTRAPDPRLRALTAERAHVLLTQLQWVKTPKQRRLLAVVGLASCTVLIGVLVLAPPHDDVWLVAASNPALQVGLRRFARRRLRRAIANNTAAGTTGA